MDYVTWNVKTFEELNIDELYQIMKVRQEVFIIEQACNYLDADGCDQNALHLFGKINHQMVAYCRLFDKGIKYEETSIGRVLTHPEFRKMRLGKAMIEIALQTIETRYNTRKVRISAQDYLLNFYGSFGFKATDKKYLEDSLPHTEMYR